MPRKKKKSNRYWTKITECAIQAYNKLEDRPYLREKVYKRFLFQPLMKLTENRINQVKPGYIDKSFEDLQIDLVTYLTERLCRIKPGKGKGYSYFTRTSWNYLVGENQRAYSKTKNNHDPIDIDSSRNIVTELHNNEMNKHIEYFMDAFVEYCYENLTTIFNSSTDIHVGESVLHLFYDRKNIEVFNKKALYIFIRERTNLQTYNITKVVNILKGIYNDKFKEYQNTDFMKLPF